MSCSQFGGIDCDTIQIIEPGGDLLVDVAGTRSDMDERGEVPLIIGQVNATVLFTVPKLNASYHFEYLYVDVLGGGFPGTVQVIPVQQTSTGFTVVFAGSPIGDGYVLHWRVTIVQGTEFIAVDFPEDQYLAIPQSTSMSVTFLNPRSTVTYGFAELRVENLTDLPETQAVIHVQVYQKGVNGFMLAINPTPPTENYFLRMRTP